MNWHWPITLVESLSQSSIVWFVVTGIVVGAVCGTVYGAHLYHNERAPLVLVFAMSVLWAVGGGSAGSLFPLVLIIVWYTVPYFALVGLIVWATKPGRFARTVKPEAKVDPMLKEAEAEVEEALQWSLTDAQR